MQFTWCKQLRCIYLLMTDCIFQKRPERPEMLYVVTSVAEATEGGLKLLLGLVVKCICLEVPGCRSLTTKYKICCPLGCCPLDTTWLC